MKFSSLIARFTLLWRTLIAHTRLTLIRRRASHPIFRTVVRFLRLHLIVRLSPNLTEHRIECSVS